MNKKEKTKVVGIILAGGSGSRFNNETPKQFVKLAGKLVIEYGINIFEDHHLIDEIIVVIPDGYEDFLWELVHKNSWKKVGFVIKGGNSRTGSTLSALKSLHKYPDKTKLIIHDAARPLVDIAIIDRCIDALNDFQAVDVVIPSTDTIVELNSEDSILKIPNRDLLRCAQTPQGFLLQTINHAYKNSNLNDLTGITCDCSLLRRSNPEIEIKTVQGDSSNIKITNPIDLHIAEKIIQTRIKKNKNRIDYCIKNNVFVIFGGSSGIGAAISDLALKNGAHVHIASRSYNNIDINQEDQVEKFLNEVIKKSGKIDVVINTAGVLLKKPLSISNKKEIVNIVNTNLISSIIIAKKSYEFLRSSRGCLVNFSSSSYTRGRAFYATYSATKAAVVNMTQALSEEWAQDNIRVIGISPERTKTPMRVQNFGIEADESLLEAEVVATETISAVCSMMTGVIFDVRKTC